MRTEEEIKQMALKNAEVYARSCKIHGNWYGKGFEDGFKSCQDEKKVDVEKREAEFFKWFYKECSESGVVLAKNIFAYFLPHLQPQQSVESEAVEFAEWKEDNGWVAIWSDTLKIRRWTNEEIFVNGSIEYFDRLAKEGKTTEQLYTEFKNRKK